MDPSQLPQLDAFSLHVTVYIKPELLDDFFKAFKPAFDAVAAEPECHYFELFEDPSVPGKVTWVENWNASPQWFLTEQFRKEYYAPYLAATEPMFTQEREFKILKRKSGYVSAKKENFKGALVGDIRF